MKLNKENFVGETPLLYACRNGNEAIIKYLVEHGADVKKKKIKKMRNHYYILVFMKMNLR